jgi:excisionase family DNA binding protein
MDALGIVHSINGRHCMSHDHQPGSYLRVREFARRFGLPRSTVYRMARDGVIEAVELPVTADGSRRVIRIPIEAADRYLERASVSKDPDEPGSTDVLPIVAGTQS